MLMKIAGFFSRFHTTVKKKKNWGNQDTISRYILHW